MHRLRHPSPEDLPHELEQVQRILPSKVDHGTLGPFVGIVYTDGFSLENNDVEVGYLLKKPVAAPIALSERSVLRMRELPAVPLIATAVQTGGPDLVFGALGRIARWIEANGYRVAGPYREIGIELPSSGALEDMTIEVQMPLEKRRVSADMRDNL